MTMNGLQGLRGALLTPVLALLAWGGTAHAQSLDEIVDAAVEATGGREAIERIETIKRSGTFVMDTEFGAIAGDTEVVTIPYEKVYQLLTSDFFTQTSAWDGSVAWQSDDFQGTVELSGTDAANLRNQAVLDWFVAYQTSHFGDVQYVKGPDEQVDGRDHFVVEIAAGGIDNRFFLDKETYLVSQIMIELDDADLGAIEVTVTLSEYEVFEGVKMATKSHVSIPDVFDIDTTYNETEINEPIDETIFVKH